MISSSVRFFDLLQFAKALFIFPKLINGIGHMAGVSGDFGYNVISAAISFFFQDLRSHNACSDGDDLIPRYLIIFLPLYGLPSKTPIPLIVAFSPVQERGSDRRFYCPIQRLDRNSPAGTSRQTPLHYLRDPKLEEMIK